MIAERGVTTYTCREFLGHRVWIRKHGGAERLAEWSRGSWRLRETLAATAGRREQLKMLQRQKSSEFILLMTDPLVHGETVQSPGEKNPWWDERWQCPCRWRDKNGSVPTNQAGKPMIPRVLGEGHRRLFSQKWRIISPGLNTALVWPSEC